MKALSTSTAIVAALGLVGGALAQPVLYVDRSATGPTHDGSSWCGAYLHLYGALNATTPGTGTTIRVADGTYLPDSTGLSDTREATFLLISGVTIEGGYAGCGAAEPDERDLVTYATVLSGDLIGDDIPGAGGGDSDCCEAHPTPGCDQAACASDICTSNPQCCSTEWTAACARIAEGRCCELCSDRNDCENSYHVIDASGADVATVLDGLTIVGGHARGASTSLTGGGIYIDGGAPTLINCAFLGNSAYAGGAVSNLNGSPTMINCAFSGNAATIDGGAIFNDMSSLTLTNCTLSGNTAGVGAGIRNYVAVTLTMTNCILWGNVGNDGTTEAAQITSTSSPDLTVNHTCIQGWTGKFGGIGNTGDDPRFVDPDGPDDKYGTGDDDPRLRPGSPVIDAADNMAVTVDTDLDGNSRIVDGDGDDVPTVDMGAYEFQGAGVP
ncbi:MAG: choice-of-anchor Q domain-containing protein, partial [Planctomycetota bacterium]